MAEAVPSDFLMGSGYGWLPYFLDAQRLPTEQASVQGNIGLGLLGSLTDLLTSPTSGPLGLAATAAFGNPQGIAAGTGGRGIQPIQQQSMFDQLLQSLGSYTQNINAKPTDTIYKGPRRAEGGNVRLNRSRTGGAWNGDVAGLENGGVAVGGEPHWIVDSQGTPVAAISEDGAPEAVTGLPGVEVTPLDPARRADYEARKGMATELVTRRSELEKMLAPEEKVDATEAPMLTPKKASKVRNVMPEAVAGYVHGGLAGRGTTEAIRDRIIGPSYEPKLGGQQTFDQLLAGLPTGGSYRERYARLLGGALDENRALPPEFLRSLNLGRAPTQLLSENAFSTLSSPQQSAYTAMLQQMGIIQSPEDLTSYIRKFAPTTMQ
jgi:hypothetical protein